MQIKKTYVNHLYDCTISAALWQNNIPVTLFLITLTDSEEKKVCHRKRGIVKENGNARWLFYLIMNHKSFLFNFFDIHGGKIKDDKINPWATEL